MQHSRSLLDFAVEAVSHLAIAVPANQRRTIDAEPTHRGRQQRKAVSEGADEAAASVGFSRFGVPASALSRTRIFAVATPRPAVLFAGAGDGEAVLA